MTDDVPIESTDYWAKVIEMLQQNWTLIEAGTADWVLVYFVSDTSGVFDEVAFSSVADASAALCHNGFRRYADAPDLQSFLRPPPPAPFRRRPHPNGAIYSSGRFWKA